MILYINQVTNQLQALLSFAHVAAKVFMTNWLKNTFTIEWISVGVFDEKAWQHDPRFYDLMIAMRGSNERSPYRNMTPKQIGVVIAESLRAEAESLKKLGVRFTRNQVTAEIYRGKGWLTTTWTMIRVLVSNHYGGFQRASATVRLMNKTFEKVDSVFGPAPYRRHRGFRGWAIRAIWQALNVG